MRNLLAIAALALVWACGGSPAGPTPQPALPPPPPPPPLSWTIGGQIVETLTSQPVSGASLSFASGASATASASGDWQLQGTGTTVNQVVSITAPGYMTRETTVRWAAGGRADVRLDLIAERSPFSLQFYREFARNAFDEPEAMRSIRRWVRTPNFYIDTRNPKTGGTLLPSEVADIERSLREAVPQITGGQFSAGAIESGAAAFTPGADYIEVVIIYEPEATFCADAFVAANPGRIRLNYERCPSSCGAYPPETIVHEVGHAMGFWHHGGNGILNPNRLRICSNRQFSDLERQHARIAYSRPAGNMDPDRDPGSFLAVETDRPVRVACR